MITLKQITADLALAEKSMTHEPENRNLNTLKCKHCRLSWWFEDKIASLDCPALVEQTTARARTALPEYAQALIETINALAIVCGLHFQGCKCDGCILIAAYHAQEKPE